MNKFIVLSLVCSGLFAACGEGSRNHKHKEEDGLIRSPADMPAAAIVAEEPDTSLISLRSYKTVSLTDAVSQLWKFDDADQPHWNEVFWDSVADARQNPELALFPDHTFTENARCGIQMGKWEVNKSSRELILAPGHGRQQTYILREIALKRMEIARQEKDGVAVIKVSADGLVHRRPEEDPFHPSNNQWRIKPLAAETPAQIRLRVRECIHFYSLFFLDNRQRRSKEISFTGLPSCFVWYNGGIGVPLRNELDKKWIDCFYSGDQAMTAYDMVATELDRHELNWPEHPTSWVQQTGEVLDQLSHKF